MRFPSDEKKSKQLGMSFGRACHILRQSILFSLVKEAGRDLCVRCGKRIEMVKELSIEHIDHWQDVDTALFWDLDNIGFSHRRCNVPGRCGPAPFIGPTGTSWCWGHQDFIPIENFAPSKMSHNKLQQECRECRSQRQKERPWRKMNKLKSGASGGIPTPSVT